MAAVLGSYKQAHTSLPLLSTGIFRAEEGPVSFNDLGSRAHTVLGDEPVPFNLPNSQCTSP